MSFRKDLAWSWAENFDGHLTDDNILVAYRLNLKNHSKSSTCRRNCRTNPRCIVGFGENKCLQAVENDDLATFQRPHKTCVGLKNLGNTCYINCFLQLWFHNVKLREAVYLWSAFEDPFEREKFYQVNNCELNESNYRPTTSVAHLQAIFSEMEFGLMKDCDPAGFCQSLSIDVELQQDAQEFSKLYITRLEEVFNLASNPITRTIIGSQFRGEYAYATKCSKCQNVSRRPSNFYELELHIKGCKTILDSLNEFVKKESLAGENKYFCSNCNQKEDAETCIELEKLPPVLHLQLIRYFYDVLTSSKKKINQNIMFPDVLDMSPYVNQPPGTNLYGLQAILMHGGTSANSGHYYAHIKTEDGWHVFDDTSVKKQTKLNLLNDDQLDKKLPKMKGFRASKCAYMLVYTKIEQSELLESSDSMDVSIPKEDLPPSPNENKVSPAFESSPLRSISEEIDFQSTPSEKSVVQNSFDSSLSAIDGNSSTDDPKYDQEGNNGKETGKFYRPFLDCVVNLGNSIVPSETVSKLCAENETTGNLKKKVAKSNDNGKPNGKNALSKISKMGGDEVKSESIKSEKPVSKDSFGKNSKRAKVNNCIAVSAKGAVDCISEVSTEHFKRMETENSAVVGTESVDNLIKMDDYSEVSERNSKKALREDCVRRPENTLNVTPVKPSKKTIATSNDVSVKNSKIPTLKKYSPTSNDSSAEHSKRTVNSETSAEHSQSLDVRIEAGAGYSKTKNRNNKYSTTEKEKDFKTNLKFRIFEEPSLTTTYPAGSDDKPEIKCPPFASNSALSMRHWSMMPPYLRRHVENYNMNFEKTCQFELEDVELKSQHKNFIKDFLDAMPPSANSPAEFITFDALTNLVKGPQVPPLDNKDLLCSHNKLNPNKYKNYKLISSKAAQMYVERFGGGPRIELSQLCRDCVQTRAEQVQKQSAISADVKLAAILLKTPVSDEQPAYWMGKFSLKNWWKKFVDSEATNEGEGDELEEFKINSDIICSHGKLGINENERKLVPQAYWDLIKKYYSDCTPIPRNYPVCANCQEKSEETEEQQKQRAVWEKSRLLALYNNNRNEVNPAEGCFLVSPLFITEWRRYIRSISSQTLKDPPDSDSIFESLLCDQHNNLIYDPNKDLDRFFLLTDSEWAVFKEFYELRSEIKMTEIEGVYYCTIEICYVCLNERVNNEKEQNQERSYYGARLFVYKVSHEVEEVTTPNDASDEYKKTGVAKKRKPSGECPSKLPVKKMATDLIRRSVRARNTKDEKHAFIIDKFTTLKDLKCMICPQLNVMPSDQHLSYNGFDLDEVKSELGLSDEEATFLRLGVPPGALLKLLADEPSPDAIIDCGTNEPETGFKGTELGGR